MKYQDYLKSLIRAWLYYGNKHYCTCCHTSFRKLLSFGTPLRINILCPKCLSLERHRLICAYISKTNICNKPIDILHFAPELSISRFLLNYSLRITKTDIQDPSADIFADIQNLPFRDECFGAAICNHVLEHIPNDIRALQELHRILKKGSWAILQVPLDRAKAKTIEDPAYSTPQLRSQHYGQDDHVRLYGLDYFDRLRSAGFSVSDISPESFLSEEEIRRYSIDPDDSIPLVWK